MTVLVGLNTSWIEKTKEHCLGFKVEESKFGDGCPPLSPTRTALVTVNTSCIAPGGGIDRQWPREPGSTPQAPVKSKRVEILSHLEIRLAKSERYDGETGH